MPIPGMTGGDARPILKYNAKARLWKLDDTSLNGISGVFDMDNAEAGWMRFIEGAAPDFRMISVSGLLDGKPFPETPGEGYRKGFRVMVKVSDKLANGKPSIREFTSNSFATKRAFDALFDQWFAGRADHPGQLPVVQVRNYQEVESRHGSNFAPIFELVRWIDRPADLGPKANGAGTTEKTVDVSADLEVVNFDDLEDDIPY